MPASSRRGRAATNGADKPAASVPMSSRSRAAARRLSRLASKASRPAATISPRCAASSRMLPSRSASRSASLTGAVAKRAARSASRPPAEITSTAQPIKSSRAACRPPWSNRLAPGANRTRKSTSLSDVSVPRAVEPTNEISVALLAAAAAKTASQRSPKTRSRRDMAATVPAACRLPEVGHKSPAGATHHPRIPKRTSLLALGESRVWR